MNAAGIDIIPLCAGPHVEDCSLTLWSAVPAATVFLGIVVASLPLGIGKTWIGRSFTPFLTLPEAESLIGLPVVKQTFSHSVWSILLAVLSALQLGSWTAVAVIAAVHRDSAVWSAGALAIVWAYAFLQLALRPRPTPQYFPLLIFIAHLVGSLVRLGAPLYAHFSDPEEVPLPAHRDLVALGLDAFVAAVLIAITFSRPLNVPSANVEVEKLGVRNTPEDYTRLWEWLTFSWIYPIIAKGTNETLNDEDVWEMSTTIQAKPVFLKFNSVIRSTLFRKLWAAHSHDMLIHYALVYFSVGMQYLQPVLLNQLLNAINGDSSDAARTKALLFALLMFGANLLKSESDLQYLWISRRASGQIRCELMTAIFEKALKRKDLSGAVAGKDEEEKEKKEDEKTGADIGKIVNLMSNDASRLSDAAISSFMLVSAPVEVIIACALLYNLLGWSAFAGFTTFVVALPINQILTKRGIKISEGHLAATDKRMASLNELVTEAKFIKFFAWEGKWIDRVLEKRNTELGWIIKDRINDTFFGLLWQLVPNIVSLVSFVVYIYSGHQLDVPTAFTAIALFGMLQHPLGILPWFFARFLQWAVSVRRIEAFFNEEEVPDFVSSLKGASVPPTTNGEQPVLGFEKASFVWNTGIKDKKEEKKEKKPWFWTRWFSKKKVDEPKAEEAEEEETPFELRDVDVKFPPGVLTLVTGPTASGKSSLLHALLGEMTMSSPTGKVLLPKDGASVGSNGLKNSVSFAAQTTWLQHATIKDNIVYGAPFDEARYDAVVDACQLKPDLKILEDGDETEIGARGVSLSGGQKARVALARAVYQYTQVILLDDPLSAVDSHTARRLLDKLFRGPLLANRTIVLVTHHVELMLPAASHIVRMLDGRVDTFGSISDLRARGQLDDIKHEAELELSTEDAVPAAEEAKAAAGDAQEKKKAKQLVEDEARAEGSVKWAIYSTYLKAASYYTWIAILVFIFVHQLFRVGRLLWMRIWGEASSEPVDSSNPLQMTSMSFFTSSSLSAPTTQHAFNAHQVHPYMNVTPTSWTMTYPNADEHPLYYVGVYAFITVGMALSGLVMNIVEYVGAYRASKALFQKLLVTITRAPFRWFDTTPTGRILNRFSRDFEVIDSSLASSIAIVITEFAEFLAGIVTISYILPGFLVPAAVVAYLYWRLAVGYLNTGRDLRRMESNSRSPVFDSFSELLSGIVTVRAFSSEQRFLDKFYALIDKMNKNWWASWMLNRYLLFRFDIIGAATVLATALLGLASMGNSNFVGWAGITITSAMSLTMSIYWTCRFYTQLELDLNSVERVVEYLEIAQEPPAVIETNRPPAYWPSSTNEGPLLQVEDLVIKYAPDLPPVLHGVSFALNANERVGLLGRTGSGKSTIAMSLLRFVDPSSGKIYVDGLDITSIGLQDLRSSITFIPQDASLFSGTIRDNLDPFGDYSDQDCAEVLHRVHLVTSPQSALNTVKSSRAPSPSGSGTSTPEPDAETSSVSTGTAVDGERKHVSLSTKVSAGGTNFSQGQRQLISLARALLRRSTIIVMDEATSSIDFETDAKIQTTIREEFKSSLLLTIAHRLKTIADYDRLIVLDKGKIVEFGTPATLITTQGGVFRDMCLKSGIFGELEAIAVGATSALNTVGTELPLESTLES